MKKNLITLIALSFLSMSSYGQVLKQQESTPVREIISSLLSKSNLNCDSYAALTSDKTEFIQKMKKFVSDANTNFVVDQNGKKINFEGKIDYYFRLKLGIIVDFDQQVIKSMDMKLYHDEDIKGAVPSNGDEVSAGKQNQKLIGDGSCSQMSL